MRVSRECDTDETGDTLIWFNWLIITCLRKISETK